MSDLNRRQIVVGLFATGATAIAGVPVGNILSSLTKPEIGSGSINSLFDSTFFPNQKTSSSYFILKNRYISGDSHLKPVSIVIDKCTEKDSISHEEFIEALEDIPIDNEVITANSDKSLKFILSQKQNAIARTSRRGLGNCLIINDENILIYYTGSTMYDSPIISFSPGLEQEHRYILNDNYKKYFYRGKIVRNSVFDDYILNIDSNTIPRFDYFNLDGKTILFNEKKFSLWTPKNDDVFTTAMRVMNA